MTLSLLQRSAQCIERGRHDLGHATRELDLFTSRQQKPERAAIGRPERKRGAISAVDGRGQHAVKPKRSQRLRPPCRPVATNAMPTAIRRDRQLRAALGLVGSVA